MANAPHGGVLKVCSLPLLLSYSWQRDLDVILSYQRISWPEMQVYITY